jgi:HK97 family phage portal protein
MSIFDKLNPVRTMEKITKEEVTEKQSYSLWGSGGKKAQFFDLNDHDVISNGYNTNPFVYAVVNKLALLMASVPLRVQKVVKVDKYAKYKALDWNLKAEHQELKGEALENVPDHRMQILLDEPNSEYGDFDFRKNRYINLLVTGNSYIEALQPTEGRPPIELWNLPPLAVTLNESNNFYDKIVEAYFNWGVTSKTIPKDKLLHSKYYNPTGSVYGLSPLSAARKAVQQVNDGDTWNAALLQNGAKPEFIIIVASGTPDTEKKKLKQRWKDEYSGPHNANKDPIVMEEDFMKLEQLGYTVKDMDWSKSQLTNMRKVYDVYGVGSEIFNDPENKIQSNKREAMRALYTDRLLPEVEDFASELQRFLLPKYKEDNLVITPDITGIDALNEEKDKVASRMAQSKWLTMNEKREEMGYERLDIPEFDEPWLGFNELPLSEILMSQPDIIEEDAEKLLKEYSMNGTN